MSLGKSKGELPTESQEISVDKTVSGKTEDHISIGLYDTHFINSESFWVGGVNLYHDWHLDSKCTLKADRKINKPITNK